MNAVIVLEDLSKRYGDRLAVDRLSMQIARGEIVTLLGGSGSGKTTTLKMINRLVEPSSGRVCVAGRDTRELVPHELRRTIGYVAQGSSLFPHLTIAENIGIGPRIAGWAPEAIARRTTELLALVELAQEKLEARFPHELSGGQQQRVALARALATSPALMLLDEPFGALDSITKSTLSALFKRIQRERELTAIWVTHDVGEAFALGSRVAVLRDGRLLQIGTPSELTGSPADDYVRALLRARDPDERSPS